MKRIIFIVFSVFMLFSCNMPNNNRIKNETKKETNKDTKINQVELEIDKDDIKDLNNATDGELSSSWTWKSWSPGEGLNRAFSNGKYYTLRFNCNTGYKEICINGPTTAYAFQSYFVLRKGSDNNFYIIYYKERDDDAIPPKGYSFVYKYCYHCYKYLVSDNFLRLEESNMVFDDIVDYVNKHK